VNIPQTGNDVPSHDTPNNKVLKGEKGEQMQGLLGDRFLRKFGGNLKRRRERLALLLKDQTPEVKAELAAELDSQLSEEDREKRAADSNDELRTKEWN
jgi:hypothetical protein